MGDTAGPPGPLQIRAEQRAALARAGRQAWLSSLESEALSVLAQCWSAKLEGVVEADRLALIRAAFADALGHGLETGPQLVGYLSATLALGPRFSADPRCGWAREVLESDLAPDVKAARLEEGTLAELRRRAGVG